MPLADTRNEARRVMEVCNACRYCEGYCAVFPAMELRRAFSDGDLDYLANLCHGCRGCYYACPYSPPHEFAINVPRAFTALRADTYEAYAWPGPLAWLFRRNGLAVAGITALGLALVLFLTIVLRDRVVLFGVHRDPGAFYKLIPFEWMAGLAGLTFGFAIVAMGMGVLRFWRETGAGTPADGSAWSRALSDVLTLRYLGGGGHGCNDLDETFSRLRRGMHHALFYGFGLCFASTSVAAFYEHGLGRLAPYPLLSPPVLLGTAGGVGMLIGASGLLWLKAKGDPGPSQPRMAGADVALLLLLWMTAGTGLLLLLLRESAAMGSLLAVHLGFVLALFVAMPYSKFMHGFYRAAALLRYAKEQRAGLARDAGTA